MIVDVPQVVPRLLPEHSKVRPRELRERVPLGPELVPEDEQVPPEPMDRVRGLAARVFERLLLEFVQDVLQAVEVRQVRVDEVVQDRVREEVRPGLQEAGVSLSQADPRLFELGEHLVVDRDEKLLRDEDGELIRVELFRPNDRPRDDEDRRVVQLDLRREVLVLGVLEGERMEAEDLLEGLDGRPIRVDDVHPRYGMGIQELAAPVDRDVVFLEKLGRRVGDDLNADHRAANPPEAI